MPPISAAPGPRASAAQADPARAFPVASASPKASAHKKNGEAHIADAARQFESLLIAQLLKSIHGEGGEGWLGTGEDQAGAQALELAQEQFAQTLANSGGLGLARMIVSGLHQAAARNTSTEGGKHSNSSAPASVKSNRPR
jgi:Rod binding domain-containing protein